MPKKQIDIMDLSFNPFDAIGNKWALLTAGTQEKFNTMTVSWGHVGVLWGKNAVTVYVRPHRYTFQFMKEREYFSLGLFDGYKDALSLCGSKSGRDCDKISEAGLTPAFCDGVPYLEEAQTVFICKKMANFKLDPEGFLDADNLIQNNYPNRDYHEIFVGEIIATLQ